MDFDGRNLNRINLLRTIQSDTYGSIEPQANRPALVTEENSKRGISLNFSILNSVKYCEKHKLNQGITDNLKKLIAYGTEEEKREFLKSSKYTFPRKFASLRQVDFELNKGTWINVCRKENCRTEEVCELKEKCELSTRLICDAAIGGVGTLVVPAGAVLIGAAYAVGSDLICGEISETICKDVKDCQNIEKCDEICDQEYVDVHPGECVTASNGQMVCQ